LPTSAEKTRKENKMTSVQNELEQWLVERVAAYCRLTPTEIEEDKNFSDYGMDSVFTLTMIGEIEDRYGLELDPTAIWDNPSVGQLRAFLETEISKNAA
jgi:acyl carrier protein